MVQLASTFVLYVGFMAMYCQGGPCDPQEGILYRIINRNSNLALDVRGASNADGAAIQQWAYGGGDNQKWKFTRSGSSYIINSVSSNKAIDIDNRISNNNGARVQQWSYGGGANQRWRIEPTSEGFCKIVSEWNGRALDVKERADVDGVDVQVWDYGGGLNQQWRLEVASTPADRCLPGWGLIKKFDFSSMDKVNQDWNVVTWAPRVVNNEKQSYSPNPRNVFTRNGNLILKAYRNGETYTSGRLESKQTYSPFEAPAKKLRVEFTGKVPTVMGAWPAYWMLGILGSDSTYGMWPACGEIDVMEWVHSISGVSKSTIHWKEGRSESRDFSLSASEMANNFITYGVEYSAAPNDEYVQYYIKRANGQVINAQRIDKGTWNDYAKCPQGKVPGRFPCSPLAPFDNHMHLIINLAVGGDWGGVGVANYDAFYGGVEFETSNVVVCEKL